MSGPVALLGGGVEIQRDVQREISWSWLERHVAVWSDTMY